MNLFLNDMRHLMTLQKRTLVKDRQGGFSERWETFDRVWGHLIPLTSSQGKNSIELRGKRRGALEESSRLYKVIARADPFVKTGMRLIWKDLFLTVLDDAERQDGYQSFMASVLLKSDGGQSHE